MSTMTSTALLEKVEQSKVEAYNAQIGSMTGCDCPICKNKGYVGVIRDGIMVVSECACMARRRSLRRLEQSGLQTVMEDYTFDRYETPKAWQKNAKAKAMDFAQHGNGWFVIVGNSGTGKTHLCTAICGSLLEQNKSVLYMLWRDEAPKLKANVNDRAIYDKMMGEYKATDVLYIDDFWKGSVTDADINLAFELLNSRYNSRKITILSGEKDIEQMLEIDEAVGSRIYERSKGYLVKTPAENYRLR